MLWAELVPIAFRICNASALVILLKGVIVLLKDIWKLLLLLGRAFLDGVCGFVVSDSCPLDSFSYSVGPL